MPDVSTRLTGEHLPDTRRAADERLLSPGARQRRRIMSSASTIKVGVIADLTGPLSFVGIANANVARMVIGDINANGGLLGRQLELCLEDSATDDAVAAEKAEKLVQEDGVAVILGGIYSSTRQAIKGAAVVEGKRSTSTPSSMKARSPTR